MKYQVSFFENKNTPIIEVVQGDSARVLEFEPTDYEIPEGAVCTYYVKRPSNIPVYNSASVDDNVVTVELTPESLSEVGENRLQVRIEKNDKILTSFTVILFVREFGGIGAVESSAEANIFDRAVAQAMEDFTADAEAEAARVIETIPADYTALSDEVDELNERLTAVEFNAISEGLKQALLQLAEKVAYIDEDGQDYYDALEEALYPPNDLVGITAVYTQSGAVYDTDNLNSLKEDLVVTARFEDASTQIVTTYTLSGTLIAGATCPITVTYNGKTTTFDVNVSYTMVFSMGTNLTKVVGSTNWNEGHGAGIEWFDNGTSRRSFYYDKGIAPVYDGNHTKDSPYYPIPVPPTATSVTVAITPSTQYSGGSFYTYSNGAYTRTYDPGWSQGGATYTFTPGQYDYMCTAAKYNNAGTSYPTEPSALTVTFSE